MTLTDLAGFYPQWSSAMLGCALTTQRWSSSIDCFSTTEPVAAYGDFNLAQHVGDDADRVDRNRGQLLRTLNCTRIQWLDQVHGVNCHYAGADDAASASPPVADSVWTDQPGLAIAVLTADCLPIVVRSQHPNRVAAIHGGWRGLLAGIIPRTLQQFAPDHAPDELEAWLGPCIGPKYYEVGDDVFGEVIDLGYGSCLSAQRSTAKRYLDLAALARAQLGSFGVNRVFGGADQLQDYCTYQNPACYSYRREAVTGRMATVAWLPEEMPEEVPIQLAE